jgi:CheY-like chemotaxis protein
MNKQLIIIDDDPISNLVCRILFTKCIANIDILTFTLPEEGFNFIVSEYSKEQYTSVVLFLDINMPVMSGWDFLKRFEELDEHFKRKFKIYMLSSSIDLIDKQRALGNKYIINFLSKPITKETILSVFI